MSFACRHIQQSMLIKYGFRGNLVPLTRAGTLVTLRRRR